MSKVTIIIPNYNGIKFMKDCIESLRIQTYKNFEILVVDNGSKDESVDYLRDLESYESNLNIKAIYLDENLGFAGGVNVGLAACDSKYVILLNNDTEVFPDYVEMLVEIQDSFVQKAKPIIPGFGKERLYPPYHHHVDFG